MEDMQLATDRIHVNQMGYRPQDTKHVFVNDQPGEFQVVDSKDRVVFTGILEGPTKDDASGDTVYRGDFSNLVNEGEYRVLVTGIGSTALFPISKFAYQDIHRALQKFFYYQRCGMELTPEFAGEWAHKACHLAHGVVHEEPDVHLPSSGGWHDAGDYGKYTVAAAKAVADMLLAYEFFPDAFADEVGIPESKDSMPDLLSEVKYELDWMLKMQREDGSVFHKVTTRTFPGLDVMPEEDHGDLVFSPVSFTAAGTFVATMAMAARLYQSVDPEYARLCLSAAEKSWKWLTNMTDVRGFHNPPDIKTGEYGDSVTADELYWAAAEMYRTTGDERFHETVKQALSNPNFPILELGWADVGGYGSLAYLLCDQSAVDRGIYKTLLDAWLARADELVDRAQKDGYEITLLPQDYIWGSTMLLMNQAIHLIVANRLSKNEKHTRSATNNFNYLLGANPLGQCYVSGFGEKPLMNPHHRPSVADGVDVPVPGMVSGGPNANLQDSAAKQAASGQPPARCFVDDKESYSTNEITIYWNSPAVFVSASLCTNNG